MDWCLSRVYADEGQAGYDDVQTNAGDDGSTAIDPEPHCQFVCYAVANLPEMRLYSLRDAETFTACPLQIRRGQIKRRRTQEDTMFDLFRTKMILRSFVLEKP
jgi:hypothetical protein